MYLENISLSCFKNYTENKLEFSADINCILGPNGSGKTNLLDAIHYLSLTKSAFNTIDQQNIQHNCDYFSVRGVFNQGGSRTKVQCSCKTGAKKIVKKDQKVYTRLSDHVGLFPVVLITPYDTDILREGSAVRRKFMDSIISQIDHSYLNNLLRYQRLLNQRNQLLKDFATRQRFDAELIASYDEPMLALMSTISRRRNEFVEQFAPVFQKHYKTISDDQDEVAISYQSEVISEQFKQSFLANHQRDVTLQRTGMGVHRDDLKCTIGKRSIRKFGSQGQQKSFVIAMKLAQFDLVEIHKQFKPILLLDDILDKLDDHRITRLIEMVSSHHFGQIFITDARAERTAVILKQVSSDIRKFMVSNGEATLVENSISRD